jgi:hypothetical protein
MYSVLSEKFVRIPLWLRIIAGVACVALYVYSGVLFFQGRVMFALIAGSVGSLCARVVFAPMRESAY